MIELQTKKINICKKKTDKFKEIKLNSFMNEKVDNPKTCRKNKNYTSKFNIKKIRDLDIQKIHQLNKKREKIRIQKQRKDLQNETEQIKKDREATKAKTELKEKWEEYQTKLLIKRKKNEKIVNMKRKVKVREKIKKQKERRKMNKRSFN